MDETQRLQRLLEELNAIERKISNISGQSVTLKYEGMSPDEIEKQFGSVDKAVRAVTTDLRRANNELTTMTGSLGAVQSIVKDVRAELGKVNDPLKRAKSSFSKIESLTQQLVYNQAEVLSISTKDIKAQKAKAQRQFKILSFQKEELKNKRDLAQTELAQALEAEKNNPTERNKKAVLAKRQELSATRELLSIAEGKNSLEQETVTAYDEQIKQVKNINSGLGLSGELTKSVGKFAEKIGFVGFSEQTDEIVGNMKELSYTLSEGGKNAVGFNGKLKVLGEGIKGTAKAFAEALNDPITQLTLVVKIFKTLVNIGNQASQAATDLARSLGLAAGNAREAYTQLRAMAQASSDAFSNFKEFAEANQQLNQSLGTSLVYSQEQLQTQVMLTKQLGLSAEEAANINKLGIIQGKTSEELVQGILDQTDGLLNAKEVAQAVAGVSADTAALYDNNVSLIAKAVMKTKELGMSMQQAKNIASGLLDFESSIDAEMEAQLLTGRSINLSRARELALQGKTAEAAAEASRQLGSYDDFAKAGPLAQRAMAKALNMSTEELGKQLQTQEAIQKLRSDPGNKGLTTAQLTTKALRDQQSSTERLADSMQTLKESFASIIEGPAAATMDFFSGMLKTITDNPIMKFLAGAAGVATAVVGIGLAFKGIAGFVRNLAKGKPGETSSRPIYAKIVGKTQELGKKVKDRFNGGGEDDGGGYYGTDGRYRDKKTGKFKKDPKKQKGTRNKTRSKRSRRTKSRSGGRRGRGKSGLISSALSMFAPDIISAATGGNDSLGQVGDIATEVGMDTAANSGGGLMSRMSKGAGNMLTKVKDFGSGAMKKVGGVASKMNPMNLVKSIGEKMPQVGKSFGKFAKKVPVLGAAIESILAGVDINSIAAAGGKKEDVYQDIGKRVLEGVGGIMGGIGATALTTAGSATGLPTFLLNSLAFTMGDMAGRFLFGKIADVVGARPIGEAVSKTFGLEDKIESANKKAPQEKIPALATGGIVDKPTKALIGEAGPEAVIPLDQLYKKFDELITVVKDGGNVYIDGDKAGRAIMMGSFKTA